MPNPDVINAEPVAGTSNAPSDSDADLSAGPGEGLEPADKDGEQDLKSDAGEDEYEVDGVRFTSKRLKEWAELDKKYKNWDAAHHQKGMELNKREKELLSRAKGIENDLATAKEYSALRKIIDANPPVREYITRLIADPQSQVAVLMKDVEDKFNARDKLSAEKEAIAELKAEIKEFDYEASQKALGQFDWDNPKDVIKASHYLLLGMNLDKTVEQRLIKAGQTRAKAPKVPPLAGGRKPDSGTRKFKTLDEAMEQFNRDNPT